MIGGIVIEIIELADRIWINCRELLSEDDLRTPSECAILVERNLKSRSISENDFVWWQNDVALWTPQQFMSDYRVNKVGLKCGMHYDIQIRKIGYSGQSRPMIKAA